MLSTRLRELAADGSADAKWLVCCGAVDPLWIENMNTVLDDNKKLCVCRLAPWGGGWQHVTCCCAPLTATRPCPRARARARAPAPARQLPAQQRDHSDVPVHDRGV